MSLSTRNPKRLIGGNPNSGFPNTGELALTRGGMLTATVYSGGLLSPGSGFLPAGAVKTADQVLLVSGPGRLNTVTPLAGIAVLSGAPLTFYDSTVVARSGASPAESGYRTIGLVNAPVGLSGNFLPITPIQFDMPFSSGLCVGAPLLSVGFTASFTVETNPNNPAV